jgi:hypothetical protein
VPSSSTPELEWNRHGPRPPPHPIGCCFSGTIWTGSAMSIFYIGPAFIYLLFLKRYFKGGENQNETTGERDD